MNILRRSSNSKCNAWCLDRAVPRGGSLIWIAQVRTTVPSEILNLDFDSAGPHQTVCQAPEYVAKIIERGRRNRSCRFGGPRPSFVTGAVLCGRSPTLAGLVWYSLKTFILRNAHIESLKALDV